MHPRHRILANLPRGAVVDGMYEVLEPLGEGGVAHVYAAIQRDIGLEVALKFITAHFSTEQLRRNYQERLHAEARSAARVRHRHVVSVRALRPCVRVTVDGDERQVDQPYFVMDRLHGHTLAAEIHNAGPMAPARALPLFLDALDGLAVAHGLGIVHKDLKPDNLFLADPGHPRREALIVMDFGVARDGEAATIGSKLPFTPAYVAPEYIDGHVVTAAVDVYQMALVLVELLTGSAAVPSHLPMECIRAHMTGDLQIPDWLGAGHLGQILTSALALRHADRIPNADVFLRVLSQVDPGSIKPAYGSVATRAALASTDADPLRKPTILEN
jgi:eukaryotic-like serine/threonine-protein kinase